MMSKKSFSKLDRTATMSHFSLAFSHPYILVFVCCLSEHGILVYIKVSTTQSLLEMFLLQSIFSLMSSQSDSPVLDSSNSAVTWKHKYESYEAERNSHFSTKMKRSDYVLSMTEVLMYILTYSQCGSNPDCNWSRLEVDSWHVPWVKGDGGGEWSSKWVGRSWRYGLFFSRVSRL